MRRSYVVLLGMLTLSRGCQKEVRRPVGVETGRAQGNERFDISFYARPLGDRTAGLDKISVWSQNSYTDSISVLITGPDTVLGEVALHLLGGLAKEGDDTTVRSDVRRNVQWKSFQQVRVDSLPQTVHGRRLLSLQASELWKDFQRIGGATFAVDSVHLTVRIDHTTIARGLPLLWD